MTNPNKISTMIDWPISTSIKSLRGFMDLTGHYCKFIKNYGTTVALLQPALKEHFYLDRGSHQTLYSIESNYHKSPVLKLPNFIALFTIKCDASRRGMRVVLMQVVQPLAYLSKTLKGLKLLLSTMRRNSLPW